MPRGGIQLKIGDLIRDLRDGSVGVVVRTDDVRDLRDGSDRYYIYWISGNPNFIGRETSEYLDSERKGAYEPVTSS
tara:strand:- start:791 stop:1018 length:228 start_codon:yes stop_codon:yes gene_type:complete